MNDSNKKTELIQELADVCAELGWVFILPTGVEHEYVPGLVLGQAEFVINVGDLYYGKDGYEIISYDGEIEPETPALMSNKRKGTYH